MSTLYYESSIAHHGVKGQRWGVRRYQNPDGSLNAAGKRHVAEWRADQTSRIYPKYGKDIWKRTVDKKTDAYEKAVSSGSKAKATKAESKLTDAQVKRYMDEGFRMLESKKISKMSLNDIKKENIDVGKKTMAFYASAFAFGIPVTSVLIYTKAPKELNYVNPFSNDGRRTLSRISKDDAAKVRKDAEKRADEEHRKRMNKINRMKG